MNINHTLSCAQCQQQNTLGDEISLLAKWTDEDPDLVPGHCTMASQCSSETDGSNAEIKIIPYMTVYM